MAWVSRSRACLAEPPAESPSTKNNSPREGSSLEQSASLPGSAGPWVTFLRATFLLERTRFCESASDEHLRLWNFNCDVHRRGLELIKPGARCMDIAIELNEMYREADLLQYRSFGYGHSFGVLSHYYGREAGVELREDIDTELRPGMVVSMEPMIMIPEGRPGAGGYREHDILVIHDDNSVENITGFPFGPEHLIIG